MACTYTFSRPRRSSEGVERGDTVGTAVSRLAHPLQIRPTRAVAHPVQEIEDDGLEARGRRPDRDLQQFAGHAPARLVDRGFEAVIGARCRGVGDERRWSGGLTRQMLRRLQAHVFLARCDPLDGLRRQRAGMGVRKGPALRGQLPEALPRRGGVPNPPQPFMGGEKQTVSSIRGLPDLA